ncbi:MAG: N-acetylmuramoyl-L-alanine amidase [Sandaracinaceae bacterium]|nr:N-acetylmuramoyl-L-alanine amidase [Sandaracinaceae bacterium]
MRTRVVALLTTLLTSGCIPASPGQQPAHFDEDLGEESLSIEAVAEGFDAEDGWLVSPVSAAHADGVRRVTAFVELLDEGELGLEARAVHADGSTGPWTVLRTSWVEGVMRVALADVEPGRGGQLRVREADLARLSVLRWSATSPDEGELDADGEGDLGLSRDALLSTLRPLGIVERTAWRARATRCTSRDGARTRMAIHHTSSPSTGDVAARVRGFQAYHMDSRGWCDVGYHFLVGADGTIYEGRPLELVGAHVGGHNTGNVGIALVGCFEPRNCSPESRWGSAAPSDAMIASTQRLVAQLAAHYGITPSATNLRGHREHSGQSTDCPGINVLHRIAEIRSGAATPAPTPTPTPTPTPSAGRSCTHSFGAVYASTACSAGYQCCDGTWRTRTSGCGACACVEESGRVGCTPGAPAPVEPVPAGGLHAGLTLRGSEIPRAGLANTTLERALGVAVEPYGTVVTVGGAPWVRGRVSHFGGPSDTGVTATETGAITGERLRELNDPERPSSATLRARPEDYYYVAMRWAYSPNGRTFWRDARLLVQNPATGARVVVRPVDWGPHTRTRRIIDLSPQAVRDLGVVTDAEVDVAFAAPGTPLGPVGP